MYENLKINELHNVKEYDRFKRILDKNTGDVYGAVISTYLAKYSSEFFDVWWDAEKFDWTFVNYLCQFCHMHFEKWWDIERIKFNNDIMDFLETYCQDYANIWRTDLILLKVMKQ